MTGTIAEARALAASMQQHGTLAALTCDADGQPKASLIAGQQLASGLVDEIRRTDAPEGLLLAAVLALVGGLKDRALVAGFCLELQARVRDSLPTRAR